MFNFRKQVFTENVAVDPESENAYASKCLSLTPDFTLTGAIAKACSLVPAPIALAFPITAVHLASVFSSESQRYLHFCVDHHGKLMDEATFNNYKQIVVDMSLSYDPTVNKKNRDHLI